MALRRFVWVVVATAWFAGLERRAAAQCMYTITNPASSFRSVVAITPADGSEPTVIDVAEGLPSVVLPAPGGDATYVGVTSLADGCPAGSLVLAIAATGERRSLSLSTPGSLGALAIHPGGEELYAVDNLVGKLFVIAATTLQVTKVIRIETALGFCPEDIHLSGPSFVGLAVSPDGERLLVTSSFCGEKCFESLTVIDTASQNIVDEVDESFTRVAFGPDPSRAYLQRGGLIAVSLFDVDSAMTVGELPIEVNGLAPAPDGVFALTNSNLLVLAPETNTVARELDLIGYLIASDLAADRAYLTTADRTEVAVLKASSGKQLRRLPLDNPSWIAAGACPQTSGGGGGNGDGCNVERTPPTWIGVLLLLLPVILFARRRRS